jgi:DNA repair photolyase
MRKENIKGRGTPLNPPVRYNRLVIEEDEEYQEEENKPLTRFYIDDSKSVISVNDSPDVAFTYSFNPYRGCEHGCVYCYARPTHSYLGFSAGLDFETKIMVKEYAHLLLEKQFRKKSYKPDVVIFSGNTDCYQPVERKLQLTRKALQVCLEFRNPVSLITKNQLVQRDIDILSEMASINLINVTLSLTTLDKKLASSMEPRSASPEMRLKTLEALAKNNIPCGVNLAPIIPGLTDEEIPELLKKATDAGGTSAGYIMLRLPLEVKDIFLPWLQNEYPDRYNKVVNKVTEMNNGRLYNSEFGKRFKGEGEYADFIRSLFNINCRKYGLNQEENSLDISNFTIPGKDQLSLFTDH